MFLTEIKIATGVLLAAAFVAAGIGAASSPAQRLEGVPGTQLQRYEKPLRLEPVPGTQLQRYLVTVPERKAEPGPKKDAKPKLDFGVTPGHGFQVPVQDDPREFRVPVQDDRKRSGTQFRPQIRPDLSGAQFQPDVKRGANNPAADAKTGPATPEVRAIRGHSAAVYFAAFSPNGETLVTAAKGINFKDPSAPRGADEVIIWDVTAQKAKHTIQFKDPAHIWSMTLSADGKTVAVGTPVGIELLDAETGKTKRTLEGPWTLSTGPFCLAFAPDGKTLAAGGSARDNIVRLWDLQTGKLTGTLKGHEDAVVGLRFSPDGKTLTSTSGQDDTTVRYWEVATGKLRSTVKRAQEESDGDWQTWPAALSPDGKILARGSGAEVKFWDAQTGEVRDRVIEGSHAHNRLVQSLAFSPDGKLVAGGRDSGEIDVWETRPADGKHDWRIGDLKQTFKKEHSHPVMALAFSPSGDLLASGDQDGMVRVWKMTKK